MDGNWVVTIQSPDGVIGKVIAPNPRIVIALLTLDKSTARHRRLSLNAHYFSEPTGIRPLDKFRFGYGTFLTSAPVDFGKLLGIYVVVFLIMAQFINFVAFGLRPTVPIVVGGMFIVAGGAIIFAWRA